MNATRQIPIIVFGSIKIPFLIIENTGCAKQSVYVGGNRFSGHQHDQEFVDGVGMSALGNQSVLIY
jgi:hypothetical protein